MRYDTLFLDRDGVINEKIDNSYILAVSQIVLRPGIREFLVWASKNFNHIIVITNQQCVGKGFLSHEKLLDINDSINFLAGSFINDFFYCPHLSSENCTCRKPKTGLFIQAVNKYNIILEKSWMIGDSETDLIPANKLGLKSIFISKSVYSKLADVTVDLPNKLIQAFTKL